METWVKISKVMPLSPHSILREREGSLTAKSPSPLTKQNTTGCTHFLIPCLLTCVIHSLELPIQAQDLAKAYQQSTHFCDIYQYITDGKLPSSVKAQNCIRAEALIYVVIVK